MTQDEDDLLRVSITFPFHLSPPPSPSCPLSFLIRYTSRLALSTDNAYRHKATTRTTHHTAAVLHPLFFLTYLLLQCLPFVRLLRPFSISITSAGARTEVAFYYTKTRPADKFSSVCVFKTALLVEEGRQLSVSQSGFPSFVCCLPCPRCLASFRPERRCAACANPSRRVAVRTIFRSSTDFLYPFYHLLICPICILARV